MLKLRTKMLLLAMCLLMVPWAGYQHIKKTESFLRKEQANQLEFITKTIAVLLKEQPALFERTLHAGTQQTIPLYAPAIKYPLHIDGYFTDWLDQSYHKLQLKDQDAYYHHAAYPANAHTAQLYFGTQNDDLYLFIKVKDSDIVYHQADKNPLLSDHIKLDWMDAEHQVKTYTLYTSAPGRVNPREVSVQKESVVLLGIEYRIQAQWQEVKGGYQVEIKLPKDFIKDSLAVNVINFNPSYPDSVYAILGTSGVNSATALSSLVYPSEKIEKLLASLTPAQTRIWVVDNKQSVLGQYGKLKVARPRVNDKDLSVSHIIHDIYRRIISTSERYRDPFRGAVTLDLEEVKAALNHQPKLSWKDFGDTHRLIATQPIVNQQQVVIGAVVAERSNQDVLILQNAGIEELINSTLLIFSSVIVLIFLFASRITYRIKKLRKATEDAISSDGRIYPTSFPKGYDELGELSQTFEQMLKRLIQYNQYLENMARNLAHEIRTPVAIVKSSLEHLELAPDGPDQAVYVARAKSGVQRLAWILSRMSEATQLEQCLQQGEKQAFPIQALIEGCFQGYQTAYPERQFELQQRLLGDQRTCYGAPESLAQALDKLIDNAMEFSPSLATIIIRLSEAAGYYVIQVENLGPLLPQNMRMELFHSMVSVRQDKADIPHLGLGLYIVRLIAEHHGGYAQADNLANRDGVCFSLYLPSD